MASGDLAGLYQQVILDHSREKHGFGLTPEADASSHQVNPTCGDELTLQLHVADGVVSSVTWEGAGCSISMASASVLADTAPGMTIPEFRETVEAFREMLRSRGEGEPDIEVLGDAVAFHGVSKYVMRVKCAMLGWVAAEVCCDQLVAAARD